MLQILLMLHMLQILKSCYTASLATVLHSFRATKLQCYSWDRGEVLVAAGSRGTLLRTLATVVMCSSEVWT